MPDDDVTQDDAPSSAGAAHQAEPPAASPGAVATVRPLGRLAVRTAVVGLVLACTFFLSPLSYLVAIAALLLGGVARSDPRTRSAGTAAMVIAGVTVVVATVLLKLLV